MVLKYLVQTQLSGQTPGRASLSQSPLSIIAHLARRIDDIKHAQARACVVWLVGQYGGAEEKSAVGLEGIADWAPDVLRKLAKSFGTEAPLVKLQTVTLASKLFVLSPTDRTISLLCQYIFSLARYDTNYDVRDRGRMLASLLGGVGFQVNGQPTEERGGVVLRREQVKLVLFDGKAGTDVEETSFLGEWRILSHALHLTMMSDDGKVQLGSLGQVTGRSMMMDGMLPDWLERGVEGSLRDSEDDAPPAPPMPTAISSSGPIRGQKGIASPPIVLTPTGVSRPNSRNGATNGPWTDLDSFYADAEEPGKESEEEESEGEEESEEEESSENDVSGSADEPESGEGEDDVTPNRRTDVPIIAAS